MARLRGIYVAKRLAALVPQLLGVTVVAFVLVRLLPGNPAAALLGATATPTRIAALSHSMGLDKPWPTQYWIYLKDLVHGNLGTSVFTGNPVAHDLLSHVPATLELLLAGLVVGLGVGVSLGTVSAVRGSRGVVARLSHVYGRLAGAFPDFWIGLVAIYIFFYVLHWFPAPVGRLAIGASPPPTITGLYTVDALLAGNVATFVQAVKYLALPALTLGFIVAPLFARITHTAVSEVLGSEYMRYARACGLPKRVLYRYALRHAVSPILTVLGILFVYLIGGDVLIEKVFSWPGVGLYTVTAVTNDDFVAVQGFVLLAATFTMIVYIVIDLIHMMLDPRVALAG